MPSYEQSLQLSIRCSLFYIIELHYIRGLSQAWMVHFSRARREHALQNQSCCPDRGSETPLHPKPAIKKTWGWSPLYASAKLSQRCDKTSKAAKGSAFLRTKVPAGHDPTSLQPSVRCCIHPNDKRGRNEVYRSGLKCI